MTVEALKDAITSLPEVDRHSLACWLNELDYDDWDRQMAKDFSQGGRGEKLMAEVEADIAAGRTKPLAEVLAQAKAHQREQSR